MTPVQAQIVELAFDRPVSVKYIHHMVKDYTGAPILATEKNLKVLVLAGILTCAKEMCILENKLIDMYAFNPTPFNLVLLEKARKLIPLVPEIEALAARYAAGELGALEVKDLTEGLGEPYLVAVALIACINKHGERFNELIKAVEVARWQAFNKYHLLNACRQAFSKYENIWKGN